MIISINWLKKYTEIDLPVADLAMLIGARLVEIESTEDLATKYKDVIVAKVMECRDVEDSDHLHVTKIDDGGKVDGLERDEHGYVQVVCGAPNVREGLLVAWLPPRSVVPETFGSHDPFILGSRQLRGYTSNGMLASARELALFDEHEGILEIDKPAQPGTSFAELYELHDTLLDIENKSLTHRPDAFGVVGFAREVAAIQGKPFTTPAFMRELAPVIASDQMIPAPTVSIDDSSLSDRYQAIVLSGARQNAMSPLQLQTYLSRSGIRPINAIVDITNYMMLATGQPLHAFDYDKLVKVGGGADIHVRAAKKDEKLTLLDGRTITLSTEDIVIAAGDTAIALAGAMGGAATEIDGATKNIILESATFNLYKLRATQMRHGMFSEAVTRFTKGQPAALTAPVLAEAVRMIGDHAGAVPVSAVADTYPGEQAAPVVTVPLALINAVLGSSFTKAEVETTLKNVEFTVVSDGDTFSVTPPYWRQDIHIGEDIIEEVGRLNGFDTIKLRLPLRDFTAVAPNQFDQLRSRLRSLLTRAGANEVLTYSFVPGELMKKVGQNPDQAYRVTNSISPELQYYRQSIVPSLLAQVHPNVRAGYDHFALYELNKFHTKMSGMNDENVPKELDSLGLVVTDAKATGAPYYEAKRLLDFVLNELQLDVVYEALEEVDEYGVTRPFEPKRSARVWHRETRERIGVVGEFKRSVTKALKLPDYTAGFEIAPGALLKLMGKSAYTAVSKFPGTERDICFQVSQDITYDALYQAVAAVTLGDVTMSVEALDLYQAAAGGVKNITLRIGLVAADRTLTGDDVARLVASIEDAARAVVQATII